MSSEVVEHSLDSLCILVVDCPHATPEWTSEGFIVLRNQNIKGGRLDLTAPSYTDEAHYLGRIRRAAPQEGDIVITREAPMGEVCQIPVGLKCCLGQRQVLLRPDPKKVDSRFLLYALQSPYLQHQIGWNEGTGSTVSNLRIPVLEALKVPTPPVAIQKEIASTLGAIDDRITLLRETNATLVAIAQALFKSWFVDFEPVRAKAEGLEPEGMDAATAVLFSDSFEESELGLVPKGWNLAPFGELLIHTIGGDWGDETPSEKNDTRVAIIRGTDIPDLQSGAANRVPLRYTSTKKLATRKLQDGDLVLEVSGGSKDQPTGRALYLTDALLGKFDCPVEPASFCRLLRPIDKHIGLLLAQHLTYIYGIGKTWKYQNQSTGIANFQTTHFLESELVAVPPREVLAVFADVVRSIVDRGHLSQIQNLASLRDTLLPRLISGQLRLPEAEAMVEEVCA
ncbi:restriction endonuclease subunit S [Pseudomonas fluorescens]|uniref:restriction endonuclease subunit S n=1 Tax=Pseudomonas fluorescens TaxID=294 RepID=UPI00123F2324|nr:restriction endonuclease subunit S [Pseudomonas fluorescens]